MKTHEHILVVKVPAFKSKLIGFVLLLAPFLVMGQWSQLGDDIDGEATNSQSGFAIDLSADGNTIIVGGPFNTDNGSASGHVRVYESNANSWQQKGNDIDGVEISDKFGFAVSISADGSIIAVGAVDNNDNGFESGHVRVFEFSGNDWVQIGATIAGEALSDHSGHSVSLSDDGTRLAIGAPDNGLIENVGSNFGHVRVYENQSGNWVQLGNDIDGENPEDNSGFSVSLNQDGTIVAIGAPNNTNTIEGAGHVRVYAYQTNTWVQIGEDIDGEGVNDKFGGAVSLNAQGNVLAVGARDNNGIARARVFENQANTWVPVGNDIDGESINDDFGVAVSLNADGTVLAVGGDRNDDFILDAGHVRVFKNQNNEWQQIDADIDGETIEDRSGRSVSLSADGSIVAIGAYLNDANGSNSGHVRVFSNMNVLETPNIAYQDKHIIYPNPVSTQIHIYLDEKLAYTKIHLYNTDGKLLHEQTYTNTNHIKLNMVSYAKGIYVLKLQVDGMVDTLKIIKQ